MSQFIDWIKNYKLPIALCLIGIVLIVGGLLLNPNPKTAIPSESLVSRQDLTNSLKVDVSGAVIRPGVYSLPSDSRVEDAIKLAGGFSDQADSNYLAKVLNLSAKLKDGQKIYIPLKGETSNTNIPFDVQSEGFTQSVINVNTASASQLESLPSVGQVTAQKIIDNRPYMAIEDLLDKKVIGQSTFEKIRPLISVN